MKDSSEAVIMQVADKLHIVELIKDFRVPDLKQLLSFAGKSKSGNKPECFTRCLTIPFNEDSNRKISEIHGYFNIIPYSITNKKSLKISFYQF